MSIPTDSSHLFRPFTLAEEALRQRLEIEEARYRESSTPHNSLWNHVKRVAALAERLGKTEGKDPLACKLAGLFHDAGKFRNGRYHPANRVEEELSVITLHEITDDLGFPAPLIDEVEESILQLYRSDPDPTLLSQILFDADNLDKLGAVGVANYCIKAGLRGKGISTSFIHRISVELTYARYAVETMFTGTGQQIARSRGPETISFYKSFLESLNEYDDCEYQIEEIVHDGLTIDVVSPKSCDCGRELTLNVWEVPGLKCSEIHLKNFCVFCNFAHELRFCRPKLTQ